MKLITLSGKHGNGKFAIVDDWNYEWLNQWKWHASKDGNTYYARRSERLKNKNKHIRMHRFILGLTDPKIKGDHKDHNGLNNQEYNIKDCTPYQNSCNKTSIKNGTSKYLGVCWNKKLKKWCAQITKNRLNVYRKYFDTEIEAALQYNIWAIEIHGEFANLNVI